VPDWPLSYGKVMPPMVGGILYEHGHRLVAAAVSILVGLEFGAILFFLEGNRRVVKWLAGAAFGAILLQALLGGLTVLLLLPPAISSVHAALAEIVFALTAVVALMCSRTWDDLTARPPFPSLPFAENPSSCSSDAAVLSSAFRWTLSATAAIYAQIVLGAVMRHTGAGLAIPDFPAAFGGLWPSADELQRRGVGLHLAHRVGAVVVLVLVLAAVRALGRLPLVSPVFAGFAAAWTGLVMIQILLGALSVWSTKAPSVTAAHLAGGALCWVTGVLATVCLGACRKRANAISSGIRA
jgi:heme a synthase